MDKKIADDIAEAFHEGYRGGYQAGYENGKRDAVRHGEWIEKEHWIPLAWDCSPFDYENYNAKTHSEKRTYWHCSKCGFEKSRDMKPLAAYCECCGARMDGKESGE